MRAFRLRLKDREIPVPDSGEVVVGRDPACQLPVDDRMASRRHACFRRVADGGLELVDLDSMNGTLLNDVPLNGRSRVKHRDRVQIGNHVVLVIDSHRERIDSGTATEEMIGRRATTRRVKRVTRASQERLDVVASALGSGDLASALRAIDLVSPRYDDLQEPVGASELSRFTLLLLSVAERTQDARHLDRVFRLHSARRVIIDPSVIDALQSALPRLPSMPLATVETYLEVMRASASALSPRDLERLDRVATVTRGAWQDGR